MYISPIALSASNLGFFYINNFFILFSFLIGITFSIWLFSFTKLKKIINTFLYHDQGQHRYTVLKTLTQQKTNLLNLFNSTTKH